MKKIHLTKKDIPLIIMSLLLIAGLTAVIIYSVRLKRANDGYTQSDEYYGSLIEKFVKNAEYPDAVFQDKSEIQAPIQIDFEGLRKENPDTYGWIYFEDTVINYPVAKSKNNADYLNSAFSRSFSNSGGTIFVDMRNGFDLTQEDNTIIYGHNMESGQMFHDLHKYKEQEYFDTHPSGWLLTPDGDYRLDVFSCRDTFTNDPGYEARYETTKAKQDAIEYAIDNTFIKGDIQAEITTKDNIVTLSTCRRNSAEYTARLAVTCRAVPVTNRR